MFDFSKLGDMAKLANEAKQLQAKQDRFQQKQLDILEKISRQLDEVVSLVRQRQ